MPTWIFLLLVFAFVARVTRLITSDIVTDPLRIWVARKTGPHSTASYFLSCQWCVSVWVAVAVCPVAVWHAGMSWWELPLMIGSASLVTGIVSRWDDDPVEIVDE